LNYIKKYSKEGPLFTLHVIYNLTLELRIGKPEMARTSAFFGSVKPKVFCQKRLKLSFPAPFFFGSFLFGRTKRNEHLKKEGVLLRHPPYFIVL